MVPGQDKGGLLYALFDPATPILPVLARLRTIGVPEDAMEVMSPIPRLEALTGKPLRSTTIPPLVLVAMLAGLVGIAVGLFFAGGTAAMYPIMTGGKPIVGRPIVGIISYETMMLVAIVTTFIAMLIKILSRSRLSQDPRIADGAMAVAVHLGDERPGASTIMTVLREYGALSIEHR
jgi:hypothetical protein